MKTIGLMGGMSWESSIAYYRLINECVRRRLGGHHSARSVMVSIDFAEIEALQRQDNWKAAARILIKAAQQIELAGADMLLICTNTMHKLADQVQEQINIPLLHIADATGDDIKHQGLDKVALLGTRFTMEEQFYKGRLEDRYGLHVLIPGKADRDMIHRVIYKELVLGIINPDSKAAYLAVIENLEQQGAQGVILGCTELGLLINALDADLPIFDTTEIHALTAVDLALSDKR
jgi:aspartate racemase